MLTLSETRKEALAENEKLVDEFLKNGGKITVCKPATQKDKTFKR